MSVKIKISLIYRLFKIRIKLVITLEEKYLSNEE
ncbi:unnamed protein product [Paramecium sonneborni]|uniref:Uncharacterized protein n=1 Tax=Paramecium sonneborni TaxID=65129 RepID=A0A8S1QLA4_9CILI|nr:unnamed protein product [Paramecium sonneborni]